MSDVHGEPLRKTREKTEGLRISMGSPAGERVDLGSFVTGVSLQFKPSEEMKKFFESAIAEAPPRALRLRGWVCMIYGLTDAEVEALQAQVSRDLVHAERRAKLHDQGHRQGLLADRLAGVSVVRATFAVQGPYTICLTSTYRQAVHGTEEFPGLHGIGVAKFNPADEHYRPHVGRLLAFRRALLDGGHLQVAISERL